MQRIAVLRPGATGASATLTMRARGMQRGQRPTHTYGVRYCTGTRAPKESGDCGFLPGARPCHAQPERRSACAPAPRGSRQTSQARMQPVMLDRTQLPAILHRSSTSRNPYKPGPRDVSASALHIRCSTWSENETQQGVVLIVIDSWHAPSAASTAVHTSAGYLKRKIRRHRKPAPGAPALHDNPIGSQTTTNPVDFAASALKPV